MPQSNHPLFRFTVSWLPPYPPYGPHDRYKLQYQLFSAAANDWRTIEVDARSRELECPVSQWDNGGIL